VLPEVSTAAMNEFLARFAATLAKDEHAVMVLDRAGWHTEPPRVCRRPVCLGHAAIAGGSSWA
jgi:hypothetical protein